MKELIAPVRRLAGALEDRGATVERTPPSGWRFRFPGDADWRPIR